MKIFLAEIEAYDPGTSGIIIYRFATGTGYDNAGTFYPPRIENPATFSRSMGGAWGGKQSVSYGELTLTNNDGALNGMADDYFDGRTVTIKYGDESADYLTFETVLIAAIETISVELPRVSLRLKDRSSTLDKPFSDVKYAGDNALPTGIEGTADDIKDQYKPRILGRIALMQPILVNTSKLIYQVNAAAVAAILQVYDGGAYLDAISGDYADLTDLYNNAPASGSWRQLPGSGLFRLGSQPVGEVSCSVAESWDYLDNTAAGLIQRILTEKGFTSADWVATDFAALDQSNAGSLGIIISDGEITASIIDRICQSVGAWWGFDNLNRFRVELFTAPSGDPDLVVSSPEDAYGGLLPTADEYVPFAVEDIERATETQPPLWQVTVRADTSYAVQDKKSLAGVVPADRAAWFSAATRDQKAEDSAIKTARALADTQTFPTALNGIASAAAEASRRLALYSPRRDVVTISAQINDWLVDGLDLGATVDVHIDKLGYTGGRLMIITGVRLDFQRGQADLTCWG